MQDESKRVIVVLGMHRSGTSTVARSLKVFGVELGSNLMQAVPDDNELGFWEDNDIYQFNESLLKKLDTTWYEVKKIDHQSLLDDSLSKYMEQAIRLIEEKTIDVPIFGFKDPRTSILLPFWQQIFTKLNIVDSYVISIRNPLSVADSLYKRDGIDIERSIQLWEKYVISAISYTNDKNRVIVNYDRLLDDPDLQLRRITRELNIEIKSDKSKDIYKQEFLNNSLRHNYYSLDKLSKSIGTQSFIYKTYELLDKLSQDEIRFDSHYFTTEWEKIIKIYQQIEPAAKYIDELNRRLEHTKILVIEREKIIEHLNRIVAERDNQIQHLNRIVAERDNQIQRLNNTLVELDKKINYLGKVMEEKNIIIEKILRSSSWRLTHPLRKIKSLFIQNKTLGSK